MLNHSGRFLTLVLVAIGLCGIPACGFLGIGNGNDNTNTNTNDNTNSNANGNDNSNTNDNGNTNTNDNTSANDNGNDNVDESDFVLFADPDGTLTTTNIRDVDGETVKFRISNQAIVYQDRIELVPVRPVRQLRGFLKGIDTDVPREPDRV